MWIDILNSISIGIVVFYIMRLERKRNENLAMLHKSYFKIWTATITDEQSDEFIKEFMSKHKDKG